MRIFLYEYCSAPLIGEDVPDSLRREGRAMLTALAEDFHQLPDVRVWLYPSPVLDSSLHAFRRLAARADGTLIIAPECNGTLFNLCREAEKVGSQLLGPTSETVALTGDKWVSYRCLREAGVPTPRTRLADDPRALEDARFPMVQKPRDGAGSLNLSIVRRPEDIRREPGYLLQEFVPGKAASVAVLTGPDGVLPLLPASQRLSVDGRFCYRGGHIPLPPPLAERARQLAERAVAWLPSPRGYLGVDLVLGDAADGSADFVIEINPRVTTSYVGLRAVAEDNIAGAMLRIARGGQRETLRWKQTAVRFRPDGSVSLA